MKMTAAAVLVLALAGSPIARVVCLIDCQHDRVTSGHCHAGMDTGDAPLIAAGYECNRSTLDGSLYVGEPRVVSSAAVVATRWLLAAPEPLWTAASLALSGMSGAWLKTPIVMRR
jgi:hypothetical protein